MTHPDSLTGLPTYDLRALTSIANENGWDEIVDDCTLELLDRLPDNHQYVCRNCGSHDIWIYPDETPSVAKCGNCSSEVELE